MLLLSIVGRCADDLLTRRAPADDNLLTGGCYAVGQRLAEQKAGENPREQEWPRTRKEGDPDAIQ
jgi:hypothetical protein